MYFRILLLVVLSQASFAKAPDGGGALPVPTHSSERSFIEHALKRARINSEKLDRARGPVLQAETSPPLLQWPIRKSIVVTDPDIQAISNFLDQDPSEAGILDYDCGDRTYDGHQGLDIFTAPFSWYKMERDHAIVVAAAPGVIVEKVGDQPERSCMVDNTGGENNVVVIEQQDGSLALYAHMRTDSLTAKAIGDSVTTGEYLGVVGSAGYSTGPHLHFEVGVWEQNQNQFEWKPRDPFAGTCNDLNVETWWADQSPYYRSALNAIATHSQAPEYPACPETEIPHYSDSFSPGDTVFFATYYRDQLKAQNAHLKVSMPNGSSFSDWNHASQEEHYPASAWYWSIALPANAMAGEWLFSVTYEGKTLEHKFYVNSAPAPLSMVPVANNAFNGAWYDQSLEGEGYNIITTDYVTAVYFYGSDIHGQRLWLVSEVVSDVLVVGQDVTLTMYESTGGSFTAPIGSARGLAVWGELIFNFTDCNSGTAVLRGVDGEKVSNIVKIAGVAGTICVGQPTADGPMAGAWYDSSNEGEGFNLIVTPIGSVIYYYGFDKDGERLWLISDLMQQTLQAGQQVNSDLFKAVTGTFAQPVPSSQSLVRWGTLNIKVIDCNHLDITMDITEGLKVSFAVKLAGVVGLSCTD